MNINENLAPHLKSLQKLHLKKIVMKTLQTPSNNHKKHHSPSSKGNIHVPGTRQFRQWLTEQINDTFSRSGHTSPYIVWCDPHRVWKDILAAVQEDTEIELWDEEISELQLRSGSILNLTKTNAG